MHSLKWLIHDLNRQVPLINSYQQFLKHAEKRKK